MDTEFIKLPVLLDGATGSNLMKRGLPTGVCVEEWILDNPQVLIQLQKEFLQAGSDVIYAPTFSANRVKLEQFGMEDKVKDYNIRLVGLSKQAVNESGKSALVAGDISPTGEFTEPFGEMTFKEMTEIYKEQAEALNEAGADLIVIETMMSLTEIRAAVFACREFKKPVFVTITVDEHGKTLTGATALSCLISLQGMGISAFGLNCSYGADKMADIIKEITPYAEIPVIAKPNAGQPDEDGCYNLTPDKMARDTQQLLKYGVKILGGCCGSTPDHIKALRKTIDDFDFSSVKTEASNEEVILANENQVFYLSNDKIESSEPLKCSVDMADELLEISDTNTDVITIDVETTDDAYAFSQNMHMARLPVMFRSDSEAALREALFYYNGKAMVDSHTSIDSEILKQISDEYGALIY